MIYVQSIYAQHNQNATCSTLCNLHMLNIIKMQHVQQQYKL